MKSQLQRADKLGAKYCVIVGESEIQSGHAQLKDMNRKTQENISIQNLEEEILKRVR
jgi:histidyl-tRNA synthetase